MSLRGENLSWKTRGKIIVENVSLDVRHGEFLGLVGSNGSGKSTLLRMLAGLRSPSSGAVFLNAEPMALMKRRDIARQMAFVEQQADTDDAITARTAVHVGRTPWLSPLSPWSASDDRIVQDALAAVDMIHKANQPWNTLSGGEKQRVHIARALAQQPETLLLDEPTNHLDIRHQIGILDLLHRLGKTTVIALHDLNHAMMCDRIAIMKDGRLWDIGTPDDLLTKETLRAVFDIHGHFVTDPTDGSRFLRFAA
ncbi:ABC transporter ATP-binding protein [Shimia haliotis]|uniref:Iron complex transport system ATP-binding protein n=1 Tax=Shimia haliotis TaxID=1280847 RepID=A0A1I4AY94_9RHOB|nr:ABC transporter ATP-binding protein [Shimia haliotis]SFK61263.1 iron complex transport system ATP-binding protein [Shimia haliotis]